MSLPPSRLEVRLGSPRVFLGQQIIHLILESTEIVNEIQIVNGFQIAKKELSSKTQSWPKESVQPPFFLDAISKRFELRN
jgi:hypothetical protein